jgi:hypothetical protein
MGASGKTSITVRLVQVTSGIFGVVFTNINSVSHKDEWEIGVSSRFTKQTIY